MPEAKGTREVGAQVEQKAADSKGGTSSSSSSTSAAGTSGASKGTKTATAAARTGPTAKGGASATAPGNPKATQAKPRGRPALSQSKPAPGNATAAKASGPKTLTSTTAKQSQKRPVDGAPAVNAPQKKAKRDSIALQLTGNRREPPKPLTLEDMVRAFPDDASTLIQVHGRKINMDSFPLDAPMYSLMRAWVQDDPFRTVPRTEASIDFFRSFAKTSKSRHPATAMATSSADEAQSPATSSEKEAQVHGAEKGKDGSAVDIDDLRKQMIERGKRVRRQKAKVVRQKMEQGLEILRQKGIHIS